MNEGWKLIINYLFFGFIADIYRGANFMGYNTAFFIFTFLMRKENFKFLLSL